MTARDDATWRRHATPVAVLLLIALLEARLVFVVHVDQLGQAAQTARDIVTGAGAAAAFQNRVLSAYLVQLVAAVTGWAWRDAYASLVPVAMLAMNGALYAAVHAWQPSPSRALRYAGGTSALFVALLDFDWFNLWDPLDVAVHAGGALALFGGRSIRLFVAVLVVGLINRESALFVALALMLSGVDRTPGRGWQIDARRVIAGAVSLASGAGVVMAMRAALFRGDPHALATWSGNLNKLDQNLAVVATVASRPLFTSVVTLLLPLAVAVWVWAVRRSLTSNGVRALTVVSAMAFAHVAFADLLETRAMIAALPYLAFTLLDVRRSRSGTAGIDASS